jgi:PAS domain-containing protein
MSLTENDEIFLERSFQRTLIELEKLVSFSGTPTAAWRRTGELCLVSPEFCRLTGRTKGELLGKKTFVYELFDQRS